MNDAAYAEQIKTCLNCGWKPPANLRRAVTVASAHQNDPRKTYWDGDELVHGARFRDEIAKARLAAKVWYNTVYLKS